MITNIQKLYEALDKVFEPTFSSGPLRLKRDGYTYIIPQHSIAYIEAKEKQSALCIKNELKIFNKLLKDIEAELTPELFFRVSKSYIVNFKYVEAYRDNIDIIMTNGCIIPIGKKYADSNAHAADKPTFKVSGWNAMVKVTGENLQISLHRMSS